jgi:ATP-binding cassette subfamily B protein
MLGLYDAAESLGFKATGIKITYEQLRKEAQLPCIAYIGQEHFVVVTPKINNRRLTIADPAKGIITIDRKSFEQRWLAFKQDDNSLGAVLLLSPSSVFYNQPDEKEKGLGWAMLYHYLWSYKKYLLQLVFSLLVGSLLQLILPFLTQSIVDTGINTNNLQFIYIVLAAQLMLLIGRTVVDFIRSRLLLFISTHINISILSDFWIKLLKLPLSFFDTKQTGDILQRIGDHHRIEQFLTGNTLSVLFSVFNLVIFSIVLLMYNTTVFFIFAVGSVLYFLWIRAFLNYRRRLDYKRFDAAAKENSATMQLIHGMQEIKLNNAGRLFRWQWEGLQAVLFKLGFKSLSLSQMQQTGALFFSSIGLCPRRLK